MSEKVSYEECVVVQRPLTSRDLSEKQQQQARERFALLKPCLEEGVSIAEVARHHALPLKTVQRWVSRYRTHGLRGLSHQTRSDRGERRGLPQDGVQVIEGLALRSPRVSIAAIHRQVCALAETQNWSPPSYGQVYMIVQAIDPDLAILAHEGTKVYQEKCDLIFLREVKRPNEWWQSDHCWLNIWLLNDEGKPARPWLTIILDEYSRMIMGYRLSFDCPAAYTTGLVLRQAIESKHDPAWPVCGIPEHFYTDHGSDFTSIHMQDVGAELSMQLVFSQPGRPRGRGKVERFFRTVKQLFLQGLPGTFSREPQRYRSARKKRKQPLMNGTAKRNAQLTLAQFDAQFRTWMVQIYHHRRHRTLKGSPLARWQSVTFVPRMPKTEEQLDGLLVKGTKPCTIRTIGITFQNRRYFSLKLSGHVGRQAFLRYDPADLSTVAVYEYEQDRERFLCRADYQGNDAPSVSLKEIETVRNARRKALRDEVRVRERTVKRFLPSSSVAREVSPPPENARASVSEGATRTTLPFFLRDLPPELWPPME